MLSVKAKISSSYGPASYVFRSGVSEVFEGVVKCTKYGGC